MPKIQAIKNLTVTNSGTNPFSQDTNFGFWPDEIIVRQISYDGTVAKPAGVFLIWCSLINGHIGSFTVNNYNTTIQPNTQIWMPPNRPMPANITFQIKAVDANGVPINWTLPGQLSISIDFIKYRD